MATIVEYNKNGKRFILLGTGFGVFKSSRPGLFGGDWFPNTDEGSESKVAVCDPKGKIYWANSDDLTVVSVDGELPADILSRAGGS